MDFQEDEYTEPEIKTHTYNISTPPITVNIRSSVNNNIDTDEDAEVENLVIVATQATEANLSTWVATLEADLLPREWYGRGEFAMHMSAASHGTEDLSEALFDESGRFRSKFTTDATCRGSGAFSAEMSSGSIIHIGSLVVTMDFRRQGIGRRMVELTLEKLKSWVFAFPAQLNMAEGASRDFYVIQRNQQIAESFWRALGFRRVGNSGWFCYATDPDHASRSIGVTDDFDPPGYVEYIP